MHFDLPKGVKVFGRASSTMTTNPNEPEVNGKEEEAEANPHYGNYIVVVSKCFGTAPSGRKPTDEDSSTTQSTSVTKKSRRSGWSA